MGCALCRRPPTAICCLLACWPAGLLAVGSFKILYCACTFLTKNVKKTRRNAGLFSVSFLHAF